MNSFFSSPQTETPSSTLDVIQHVTLPVVRHTLQLSSVSVFVCFSLCTGDVQCFLSLKQDGGLGLVLKEDDSRSGCIMESVDENGAAGRV